MSRQPRSQMPLPFEAKDEAADVESVADQVETVEEKKQVVSKPINVVAMRAGYYKQQRKIEGDKFTIDGQHQLGSWMKKI